SPLLAPLRLAADPFSALPRGGEDGFAALRCGFALALGRALRRCGGSRAMHAGPLVDALLGQADEARLVVGIRHHAGRAPAQLLPVALLHHARQEDEVLAEEKDVRILS